MTELSVAEIVTIVLTSVGAGGVVVSGLVVWLGRVWLNRIHESDRARFAAEIERLKSELHVKALEHQTLFTRYHERRSEVLEELYGRLWYASARIANLVNLMQSADTTDRIEPTQESLAQLEDFFYRKRIFLSEELAVKIDGIIQTIRVALARWQRSQRPGWSEKNDPWVRADEAMRDEVPPVLRELESEFRSLLSV